MLTSVRLRLFIIKRGHSLSFTRCEDWTKSSVFSWSHGAPRGTWARPPGFERPVRSSLKAWCCSPAPCPISWLGVSLPVRHPPARPACLSRASSRPLRLQQSQAAVKGTRHFLYLPLHPEACVSNVRIWITPMTKPSSHKMLWFLDFLYERGVCMELHYVHFRSGVPGSRLLCQRTHNYSKINSLMTSPKTGTNSKQNKRCSFLWFKELDWSLYAEWVYGICNMGVLCPHHSLPSFHCDVSSL